MAPQSPHIEKVQLRSTRRVTSSQTSATTSNKTTDKRRSNGAGIQEPTTTGRNGVVNPAVMLENFLSGAAAESSTPKRKVSAHAKVEVVSCFRSSGSMPIPKPAAGTSIGLQPKKKPSQPPPPPPTHEAQEIDLNVETYQTESLQDLVTGQSNRQSASCNLIGDCETSDYGSQVGVGSVTVLDCPAPPPPPPKEPSPPPKEPSPPPPKKASINSCKKHSRCHCNLLSLEVDDFFLVVPQ